MKRIFSIIIAVMMLLSVSLVASADNFVGMKSVAVETDEGITVTVSVYGVTGLSSVTASVESTSDFSFVKGSYQQLDVAGKFESISDKVSGTKARIVTATSNSANYITKDAVDVLTYKIERVNESASFTSSNFVYSSGLYKAVIAADQSYNSVDNPANFVFEYVDARTPVVPDEPTYPQIKDDEVFEDGEIVGDDGKVIETTAATKSIAVFGKAATDLAAKSYGVKITMGGKVYTFPGLEPVAKDQLWAVKVITPDGSFNFKDGAALADYTVEAY